jgi:hypothetical protein
MKKFLKRVLAPVIVAAMLVGAAAPAAAESEPGSDAVSSSTGWQVNRGSFGLEVSLPPDSLVGGLLGWALNPIINNILTPVTSALNGIPAAVVNPLLGAVAGESTAGTPSSGSPASEPFSLAAGNSPSSGNPASCTDASGTCYASPITVGADLGILKLALGTVHGLTEPVSTASGYDLVAQSQVAGLDLGLLGIDLLKLDALTSSTRCTVVGEGTPRATASSAGLSLLGGIVTVGIAEGTGALNVSIAGTPIVGLGAVDLDAIAGDIGSLVDVSLDEHLLRVGIGLSVEDLLRSLGVPGLWDLLRTLVLKKADAKIVLEISNGLRADETSAEAAGLHLGDGLDVNIEANLLRLVGARIATAVSAAAAANNLVSLDLARTSCASTATPGADTTWVDPGLT